MEKSAINIHKWQEQVKKEFSPVAGPQYLRLLKKIKNGDIKDESQLEEEFKAEKEDLQKQRDSIKNLKKKLKSRIRTHKKFLLRKCKNIDADVYFEDLERDIDKLSLYGGIDVIINELVDGKTIDQVQKKVLDVYDKEIQAISGYARNEYDALNLLKQVIERLNKAGTQDAKKLISKIEKVVYAQGILPAAKLAISNEKEIKGELQGNSKDLQDSEDDFKKLDKLLKRKLKLKYRKSRKVRKILES